MALAWQDSLFGEDPAEGAGALDLHALQRRPLDERSWLDVARGWVPDHADLLDELVRTAPWRQRERRVWDADVLEPRLVAVWGADELDRLPPILRGARELLGERYGVEFDSALANLYRDGRDGVAWHGDTVRKRLPETVVVTIGLGERRRFLLRPGAAGPPAVRLDSGGGDLVVMGGRCQHEWQHTVPKDARAGTRLSVTMRHSRPLPARR
ncbi:alpha-ketoglutarate-dependent dioxygenase AlkB [Vallicoccus soli]|uniref:Alpha-ketoglutarate-dependent dioxygenase AlkB n=1 Tax=Vallicoccus soli TaxID=2339232 RepID=A0A3A3YZR7_9ACTN|nr:alpha-ketoglutarate-dependent dioxygenase AlkB [Vallicoccus soli]RJK96321.1 alpha-ketoglutarate-dependent dioxygenase AlkB [Vallicoccus soli]